MTKLTKEIALKLISHKYIVAIICSKIIRATNKIIKAENKLNPVRVNETKNTSNKDNPKDSAASRQRVKYCS